MPSCVNEIDINVGDKRIVTSNVDTIYSHARTRTDINSNGERINTIYRMLLLPDRRRAADAILNRVRTYS